jgi:hypothetical protein
MKDAKRVSRPANAYHNDAARMTRKMMMNSNNAAHRTGAVSLCCAKKKRHDRMTGGHAMAHCDHTPDDPSSVRHCGMIVPDALRAMNTELSAPAGVREASKMAMWRA